MPPVENRDYSQKSIGEGGQPRREGQLVSGKRSADASLRTQLGQCRSIVSAAFMAGDNIQQGFAVLVARIQVTPCFHKHGQKAPEIRCRQATIGTLQTMEIGMHMDRRVRIQKTANLLVRHLFIEDFRLVLLQSCISGTPRAADSTSKAMKTNLGCKPAPGS